VQSCLLHVKVPDSTQGIRFPVLFNTLVLCLLASNSSSRQKLSFYVQPTISSVHQSFIFITHIPLYEFVVYIVPNRDPTPSRMPVKMDGRGSNPKIRYQHISSSPAPIPCFDRTEYDMFRFTLESFFFFLDGASDVLSAGPYSTWTHEKNFGRFEPRYSGYQDHFRKSKKTN
jgi:hypothetical protein